MKKVFVLLMLAAACCLAGCEKAPQVSGTSTDSSTEAEVSAPENSIEESSIPESSKPETSETESASDIPEEGAFELPDDFSISDYITDFDDVEYASCSFVGDTAFPQADAAAVERAVETYKSSEMYAEAIDELNKIFHYENGGFVRNEGYEQSFYAEQVEKYYLDKSRAPEPDIIITAVRSFSARLDGKNTGSVILLKTALPRWSWAEYSGNVNFHVPVFVNSAGEGQILYEARSQDYGMFKLLDCSGTFHAVFGFGHNESGQDGAVYSFNDDTAMLAFSDYTVDTFDWILLGGYGWYSFEPLVFDKEKGEFCGIKGVAPSEELAKIICSDKIVLAYVPDAWERYKDGGLQIIGGKYVTFGSGIPWKAVTFVYNKSLKFFEHIEQSVMSTETFESVKYYNIKLKG